MILLTTIAVAFLAGFGAFFGWNSALYLHGLVTGWMDK